MSPLELRDLTHHAYTPTATGALLHAAKDEQDFGAWLARTLADVDALLEPSCTLATRCADPVHSAVVGSLVSSGAQWSSPARDQAMPGSGGGEATCVRPTPPERHSGASAAPPPAHA